jgi:R.HinP1I restriction endonuclease
MFFVRNGLLRLALLVALSPIFTIWGPTVSAQTASKGSEIAKAGFRNEAEIAAKFNNWRSDSDARLWLAAMGYLPSKIESVAAKRPHGEKSDVEVTVTMNGTSKVQGISIKLVSNTTGFNQIDKRWVSTYAKAWKMPSDVADALRYFVGEIAPIKTVRTAGRMYLNELSKDQQKAVVDFFTSNKELIASDIFEGDGGHAAQWFLVAYRASEKPLWAFRPAADAVRFFSEGPVEITRAGNLKIGRITMQRKGGDGGRETAKMLQFKINPVQLLTFEQ